MSLHVVTGGAGFIGSHIVSALVGRGDRVVVLDNFSTGKPGNLSSVRGEFDIREVDLATDAGLRAHLEGADTVFHQAAIPSVPRSLSEPIYCHQANLTATLRLLEASRQSSVRRVVYASSCAVYGDSPVLPKHEGLPPEPVSPYGAQKYFGEIYARLYWQSYGLETVALRYFNVFGPRQDAASPYSGVVARFVPALLEGRAPTIYGDGRQSRDFIYVGDVVAANLRAAVADGVGGGIFNVATGQSVTVNTVFEEIRALTGRSVDALREPARAGDILHSQADVSRAREILGWESAAGLGDGLREIVQWYRENPEPAKE